MRIQKGDGKSYFTLAQLDIFEIIVIKICDLPKGSFIRNIMILFCYDITRM